MILTQFARHVCGAVLSATRTLPRHGRSLWLFVCCFASIIASIIASSMAGLGVHNAIAQSTSQRPTQAAKFSQPDTLGEFANFGQWPGVADFITEISTRDGLDRNEVEAILKKTRYVESAIQLMRPAPPGRPKNWQAYRARFVEPIRINAGVAFWNQNASALARAEAQYGVPAEIIVGIIGVETVYGRNTGNFRVMDAISTLAFAYPDTPNKQARTAYFRSELESTILFARETGIDPFSLYGSYAGAIGWPQFMPSSIRQYAVDFDGDGKVDLRNSQVDAIGSVANFLVLHGWKSGEPIVFPATLKPPRHATYYSPITDSTMVTATDVNNVNSVNNGWEKFIAQSLEAKFTLEELAAGGIEPTFIAPVTLRYGLVDLQNGAAPTEYWLGTNNFFAITQYNRSFFYAMSVVDLGKAVRVARNP
jgi:membrane-bound lytic murein transglycosylase B